MRIKKKKIPFSVTLLKFLKKLFLKNPIVMGIGMSKSFKETLREEIVRDYSRVIDEIPKEIKQLLTLKTLPLTPQESFVKYFSKATPKYEFNLFKLKFTEIFCTIKNKYLSQALEEEDMNRFWQEFRSLFNGVTKT